ncbi:uncharacterized protein Dana_GF12704 [Drosophila ananassae]|uniref:Uncharacterized protein n=1 Tax=Drosophila ananassae TaxID=7217 RepID=B3MI63_DROAN|nr:inner centromere protein [Drosophila ananassae]EDV35908.1 uncharacterized protein Dana_GF12704 [Drosophila ananassae]
MEDVAMVLTSLTDLQRNLESLRLTHAQDLDHLFYGTGAALVDPDAKAMETAPEVRSGNSSVTPQQTKKRPKRLSSLIEDKDEPQVADTTTNSTVRQIARISNSQLLAIAEDNLNSTASLMPPPPAPTPAAADTTLNSTRPQRAAKLRTEGLMKEPSLSRKMRRPSNEAMVKVKLENEQRPSQFNAATTTASMQEKEQAPKEAEPAPELAMDQANADEENAEPANNSRTLRVKIKREKLSNEGILPTPNVTNSSSVALEATVDEARPDETVASQEPGKKGRKKKKDIAACHRPIKVERFSELETRSPVASRTRKGSTESRPKQDRSIYKDAMEEPPIQEVPTTAANQVICNETVTISNATMVLGPAPTEESMRGPAADATFEVFNSGKKQTEPTKQDSLLTEDESLEEKLPLAKLLTNVKAMKLPARPHELFNPLLQSPVKMRVEAFENAASAQGNLRPKRVKDVQSTPLSGNTPKVGRLPAPAVGRFFTPTQTTSMLPASSAQPKKAPASASKATTLMKTATGTNLKSTNSSSTKTLSRENSGDDFRKGLHNLAEERKKQREQKHLQAALQREAKDRERAERMAKVAADRIKKQEERKRIEERKRQELEELQRKMRQQEEAEALKKAKLKEQEQQKLQQLTGAKPKKMLPPPPKTKYTWEMLHEDDSTDDEGKVTHKRPPAPTWSRSHVRGDAIIMQSHCPTDVIDSFFSVAPTTPDLKQIFPNIDPSQLKRNSSVLWSTPPRYSELPKY